MKGRSALSALSCYCDSLVPSSFLSLLQVFVLDRSHELLHHWKLEHVHPRGGELLAGELFVAFLCLIFFSFLDNSGCIHVHPFAFFLSCGRSRLPMQCSLLSTLGAPGWWVVQAALKLRSFGSSFVLAEATP